jgi:hypothetical protein
MRRWLPLGLLAVVLTAVLLSIPLATLMRSPVPAHAAEDAGQPVAMKVPAPDFQDVTEWINSKPLTWDNLRGQVVVVHFWTFG